MIKILIPVAIILGLVVGVKGFLNSPFMNRPPKEEPTQESLLSNQKPQQQGQQIIFTKNPEPNKKPTTGITPRGYTTTTPTEDHHLVQSSAHTLEIVAHADERQTWTATGHLKKNGFYTVLTEHGRFFIGLDHPEYGFCVNANKESLTFQRKDGSSLEVSLSRPASPIAAPERGAGEPAAVEPPQPLPPPLL